MPPTDHPAMELSKMTVIKKKKINIGIILSQHLQLWETYIMFDTVYS
jgi:hypothetical protein